MNLAQEEPVRLAPRVDTVRRLYLLSGNLCAFPNCNQLMYDENGNFVGKICHIEAAMPGGERFNPNMTNEERRKFENLVLMCEQHHIETNKVHEYPVVKMKEIKKNHENKFSSDVIVQKIINGLKDYTKIYNNYSKVSNLENLYNTISYHFNSNYTRNIEQVEEDVEAFNEAIERYLNLSLASRRVFLIALSRSHHPITSYNNEDEETLYVDFREVANVMGQPYYNIEQYIHEIESNGLMAIHEVDINSYTTENRYI